jgi:hypothetical protein
VLIVACEDRVVDDFEEVSVELTEGMDAEEVIEAGTEVVPEVVPEVAADVSVAINVVVVDVVIGTEVVVEIAKVGVEVTIVEVTVGAVVKAALDSTLAKQNDTLLSYESSLFASAKASPVAVAVTDSREGMKDSIKVR